MFWLSMLGLSLMVCRGFLFVCCFCNYAVGKTCRLTFQWADQAHHLQRSPVWTRAVQATFGSLLSGDCTTWLPFYIRFRPSFRKKAARTSDHQSVNKGGPWEFHLIMFHRARLCLTAKITYWFPQFISWKYTLPLSWSGVSYDEFSR